MLSKTALHAVKAMVLLAENPDSFHGAASVAEKIGAPRNYLGKLLQGYILTGLVDSQKGMGGGFQLAKKPEDISLYDIVEQVDHVSRWEGCFMGRDACNAANPCEMHDQWVFVRNAYLDMLKRSTLAHVIGRRTAGKLP